MGSPPSLTTLLGSLAAAGVDFVVVGGLAAVAQGAPITTHDLDIVHARTAANVGRLMACLTAVDARYRGRPAGEILRPAESALLGPGHHLLMTTLGPLDVLGAIEEGRAYDDLLADSREAQIGGRVIRVLSLAEIVRLKRASAHPKDRLMLPILEATLKKLAP